MTAAEVAAALGPLTDDQVARVAGLLSLAAKSPKRPTPPVRRTPPPARRRAATAEGWVR